MTTLKRAQYAMKLNCVHTITGRFLCAGPIHTEICPNQSIPVNMSRVEVNGWEIWMCIRIYIESALKVTDT